MKGTVVEITPTLIYVKADEDKDKGFSRFYSDAFLPENDDRIRKV